MREGSEGREKQYFSSGVQIDMVSLSVGMETVDREKTGTGNNMLTGGQERDTEKTIKGLMR